MGLSVSVGLLDDLSANDSEEAEWLRESLAKVNDVLAEYGLPKHNEPEHLPRLQSREAVGSFPYSFLHHLRRAYARIVNDPGWIPTPVGEGEDPVDDPVLDSQTYLMDSHLLCHSDCEGFYLPIDFNEILLDEKNQDRIPGGLLGSSKRLIDELVHMAPTLGIELVDGQLSDSEAGRINRDAESEEGLWIEKTVWPSLFEAARLSIQYKTAICFG